jgi:hypothetical protein
VQGYYFEEKENNLVQGYYFEEKENNLLISCGSVLNFIIQLHRTFALALHPAGTHDYYTTSHRLFADTKSVLN